jgi:hypothetical protein
MPEQSQNNRIRMNTKKQIYKSWTPAERRYMNRHYSRKPINELAAALHRSFTSIHAYAAKNNIRKEYRKNGWTPQEEKILMRYYPQGGAGAVLPHLHRTRHSIRLHARIIGVKYISPYKPWTSQDDDYIRLHYQTESDKKIAQILHQQVYLVNRRRCKLHLRRLSNNGWTAEEIELLKQYYPATPSIVLARKLGRTQYSVTKTANRLGISKSRPYPRTAIQKNNNPFA